MNNEKIDNLCGEVACAIKEAYEQGAVDQKLNDIGFEDGLEAYAWEHAKSILHELYIAGSSGWIKIDPNDPNTFPTKGCSLWLWVAINEWTTIAQYACGVFRDIHGVTFKKQPEYWMMLPSIPPED